MLPYSLQLAVLLCPLYKTWKITLPPSNCLAEEMLERAKLQLLQRLIHRRT